MKVCSVCGESKPLDEYYKDSSRKDGYEHRCKDCLWEKSGRHRVTARRKRNVRKTRQVIGDATYNPNKRDHKLFRQILKSQDFECAICGKLYDHHHDKVWHMDHDHRTGLIRGVLCVSCNMALGHFKDNPESLKVALAYLAEK